MGATGLEPVTPSVSSCSRNNPPTFADVLSCVPIGTNGEQLIPPTSADSASVRPIGYRLATGAGRHVLASFACGVRGAGGAPAVLPMAQGADGHARPPGQPGAGQSRLPRNARRCLLKPTALHPCSAPLDQRLRAFVCGFIPEVAGLHSRLRRGAGVHQRHDYAIQPPSALARSGDPTVGCAHIVACSVPAG